MRLLAAKAKVAPKWAMNTPRMELNGAQLSMRATLAVVKAPPHPPERVWVAGDSKTILACREKSGGFFGEYFSNRIGECHDLQGEICPVGEDGEWWHVSSADNLADRNSCLDSVPADLGLHLEWQQGPDYLKKKRKGWPFEQNFAERKSEVKVPQGRNLRPRR